MKKVCEEYEIKGMSQKTAREYTDYVNVPIDIDLYIRLYNLHEHQKGSKTLENLLRKCIYFFDI